MKSQNSSLFISNLFFDWEENEKKLLGGLHTTLIMHPCGNTSTSTPAFKGAWFSLRAEQESLGKQKIMQVRKVFPTQL